MLDYTLITTWYKGQLNTVRQLLNEAHATGDPEVIEALDAYTIEKGDQYVHEELFHIRFEHHHYFKGSPTSAHNMPARQQEDNEARDIYYRLPLNDKYVLLGNALLQLAGESDPSIRFSQKSDWVAVELVLRYRLNKAMLRKEFYDYACIIQPDSFDECLKITPSTHKNFSTYSLEGDYEAWNKNALEKNDKVMRTWHLCRHLWETLKSTLLSRTF